MNEVCDMFLCEARAVYLQPDKLYRFKVDLNCPRCLRYAKEAAPPPTTTNSEEKSATGKPE